VVLGQSSIVGYGIKMPLCHDLIGCATIWQQTMHTSILLALQHAATPAKRTTDN
jgi:hypothetical protein